MTRDDIMRMALEVGFVAYGEDAGEYRIPTPAFHSRLERFAALVAAAERNKVAQWMIDRSYATGYGDTVEDLLKELAQSVREEEQELCAQVCDEVEGLADDLWNKFANPEDQGITMGASQCAAAIRARGEK